MPHQKFPSTQSDKAIVGRNEGEGEGKGGGRRRGGEIGRERIRKIQVSLRQYGMKQPTAS